MNLTGCFSRIDEFGRVHIALDDESRDKMKRIVENDPMLPPYWRYIAASARDYIGIRHGAIATVNEFVPGDFVAARIAIVAYSFGEKKKAYRLEMIQTQ